MSFKAFKAYIHISFHYKHTCNNKQDRFMKKTAILVGNKLHSKSILEYKAVKSKLWTATCAIKHWKIFNWAPKYKNILNINLIMLTNKWQYNHNNVFISRISESISCVIIYYKYFHTNIVYMYRHNCGLVF